jgi:hypothetical protein
MNVITQINLAFCREGFAPAAMLTRMSAAAPQGLRSVLFTDRGVIILKAFDPSDVEFSKFPKRSKELEHAYLETSKRQISLVKQKTEEEAAASNKENTYIPYAKLGGVQKIAGNVEIYDGPTKYIFTPILDKSLEFSLVKQFLSANVKNATPHVLFPRPKLLLMMIAVIMLFIFALVLAQSL